MGVVCQAAWACKNRENCLTHGQEHTMMHDCSPGLCLNQPQEYRSRTGRRRKIRCLEPAQAALAALKRRDTLAAFGS